MDHGLAQYEARERLLWLLFLPACLLMALPAVWIHLSGVPHAPLMAASSEAIRSLGFWSQRHWMHVGPLGKVLAYLAWVGVLFLLARCLWLFAQFFGKRSLVRSLQEIMPSLTTRPAPKYMDSSTDLQKKPSAGLALLVNRLNDPLRFLLHSFRRAQYTLSSAPGIPFTEGLLERQQILSDMDRRLFRSSWNGFRWILRLLPVLAAAQSFWTIYSETQLFFAKESELDQFVNAFWPAMLPVVQMTVVAVLLGLACAFLIRVEGLYLANLDAALYDQMFTELPIRSSDTVLILQSLQKHFRDLQVALKRLEGELKNRK